MEHVERESLEHFDVPDSGPSEEELFRREWDVVVAGGGIIGLWSALYLSRSGARVLLVDASEASGSCSGGSAGLLVPSRCKPLPAPGRIREGLGGLFGVPGSTLNLDPGLDPDLWAWLVRFALNCRKSRFEDGSLVLREMGRRSLELMETELGGGEEEILPSGEGILFPYYDRGHWIRAVREVRNGGSSKEQARVLSAREAREAEPGLDSAVLGAILQTADRRIEPERLLDWLEGALQREGVPRLTRTRIYALDTGPEGDVELVRTTRGALRAGQVLLAAGGGTGDILRSMGAWLPIRSGVGWSVSFGEAAVGPRRGLLLEEARVGMAPWYEGFRVTGGLELSGRKNGIHRQRLQRILRLAKTYLPELDYAGRPRIRRGDRPLTPDGLPVLGRMPGSGNLWVAAGHANLGLTLGAASGELMAAVMGGSAEARDEAGAFSPSRFL